MKRQSPYPQFCLYFCAAMTLAALSTLFLPSRSKADDFDQVRQAYLAPYLMEGVDPSSPEAKTAVADLDFSVADLLATQITIPGVQGYGGWDPNMNINSDEISYNGTYFRRTLRLARAWACPASDYYQSPEVATSLNLALQRALPLLETHKQPDNWWAWEIGIPQRLSDTLLLAGDVLSTTTYNRSVTELEYLTRQSEVGGGGGANDAWRAYVQARTGLVTGNTNYLDMASAGMNKLLLSNTAIQPDYSYFFHGDGLNIGYGFGHWDAACVFSRVTDGTQWAFTPDAQEILVDWTNEFFTHNTWNGMWSPWSVGRARTRPYGDDGMEIMRPTITMDALSIIHPLLDLANSPSLPEAERQKFYAMALEHQGGIASPSDDPSFYYLYENTGLQPAQLAYESCYFPYTDYLTARRQDWYAAVRLNSTRTITWFSIADENLLGHEQAEGTLALMTRPEEFAYDVLVTMPWDDLPGVTRQAGLKRGRQAKGQATQTSGVAKGECAVASFDYKLTSSSQSVTAKKSYFTLPNAVVMLGSDIESVGSGETTTTLYMVPMLDDGKLMLDGVNVPKVDGETAMSSDGHWFYLGNVGVVPMESMDCELEVQTITATSDRINELYVTDEVYTNQYASLRVQHGQGTTDGSYAAVLLPTATPQEVAAFAAAPTIDILANNDKVQAISTGDHIMAAFFKGAQLENKIWVDGSMDLLCQQEGGTTTITGRVTPGSSFDQTVFRKVWLPGGYDFSQVPEVVDAICLNGGTSLTLQLKTGQDFEIQLPSGTLGHEEEKSVFKFDSPYEFAGYFGSVSPTRYFSHDPDGIGSDGLPGHLRYTSPGGSAPDVAIYSWITEGPGWDNHFEDFTISVDVKFADFTTSKQFFGIALNIDSNRADGLSNPDCLILQLRNVDQGGETVDQWKLRRGSLEVGSWGNGDNDLFTRNFPANSSIPQGPEGTSDGWLRLLLTVENDEQDGLTLVAQLIDLTSSETIDSWTLEGLDYLTDLGNAAMLGEVGFLANDSLGVNSVLVDRFFVQAAAQIPGDANGDGRVDGSDVTILANNWQRGVNGTPDATWAMGDFNGDGRVDGSDVTILANHWQTGVTSTAAAVPEPSVTLLLVSLLLILLGRRAYSAFHPSRN